MRKTKSVPRPAARKAAASAKRVVATRAAASSSSTRAGSRADLDTLSERVDQLLEAEGLELSLR